MAGLPGVGEEYGILRHSQVINGPVIWPKIAAIHGRPGLISVAAHINGIVASGLGQTHVKNPGEERDIPKRLMYRQGAMRLSPGPLCYLWAVALGEALQGQPQGLLELGATGGLGGAGPTPGLLALAEDVA